MTNPDTAALAALIAALPGIRTLYPTQPLLLDLATTALTRQQQNRISIDPAGIHVRVGIDTTRTLTDISNDIHDAITKHYREQGITPTKCIAVEIASIH